MRCITSNDGTRYIRPNYRPARGPKPMGGVAIVEKKNDRDIKASTPNLLPTLNAPLMTNMYCNNYLIIIIDTPCSSGWSCFWFPSIAFQNRGMKRDEAGGQGELAVPCGGSHKLWPYQCTWELVTTALL